MSLARTRLIVLLTGILVGLAIVAGMMLVGGPDTGRRDRRDAQRLSDLRIIAEALICHSSGHAEPLRPMALAEITPACLSTDRAGGLRDPGTGAAYRIARPDPLLATVCADFEHAGGRAAEAYPGWPPFDPATGCVTATLTRS